MTHTHLRCFASILALAASALAAPSTESWVHVGEDGKLVYRADAHGNRVPDFSNVGYRGGGVALPDLPIKATVEPGEGDAGARIQAALDAVAKMPADASGHRGAVLLKKGRYPIQGTLRLTTGGVVLRGEGQGEEGTVLIATGAKQRSLIVVGGKAARMSEDDDAAAPAAMPAGKNAHRRITDDYVPVGAKRLHVDNATGLRAGMDIVVKRPSTADWIRALGMDRIPQNKQNSVVQWKAGSKDLLFERTLVAVTGNELTLNAPLVCALEQKYGGGEVLAAGADDAVRECGVENLRGDSEFKNAEDEAHGWVLVDVTTARDSWLRHVTAIHFGYSCVNAHRGSRALTIENCQCLDAVSQITGGRRYSFALDSALTLVQHCYARNGRHDFVMHALAVGPNVFSDCTAEQAHADSGPHHRWSVGVLYDNVTVTAAKKGGGGLNIRNRAGSGTGHGWAGANQVLWNCSAEEIICEQPPTAQNWALGCRTKKKAGNGYWESFGTAEEPKSLYAAQLRDRLATAPAK